MIYIYPLFESSDSALGGIRLRLRGIFLTEEEARKAFDTCPNDEDGREYQIEEWPADTLISRFDIRVIDVK